MATKIIHKKSTVASKVPLATDLEQGELAVNLTDQKIYSKDGSNNVVIVGEVNDAGGSIDADTLDSLDSTQFLRSDAADTKTSGDLKFSDSVKANFGQELDMQVYHDGFNSYVRNTTAGDLRIASNSLRLMNNSLSDILTFDSFGAGTWRYDGSNAISVGSSGTTIDWGNLQVNGNIGVTGTVDGRDIATNIPASLGTAGQVLTVNGTATATEWTDAASGGATGGGSDAIFWENDQTVTTDYTITNGMNAGSFGPITINSGVTVTVGAGETWTVV